MNLISARHLARLACVLFGLGIAIALPLACANPHKFGAAPHPSSVTGGVVVQSAAGLQSVLSCDGGGIVFDGGVAVCGAGGGSASAQELAPIDLSFHELAHGALPGFLPANLITSSDSFPQNDAGYLTIFADNGATIGPYSIFDGGFIAANTSNQDYFAGEGNALTVPQFAQAVRIVSITSTTGNNYENPGLGYYKDNQNYVLAVWERRGHSTSDSTPRAAFRVTLGGTGNWRGEVSVPSWSAPLDLGMSLVSNTVVLWERPSGGSWTVVTSYSLSEFDMRSDVLAHVWKPAMALATDSVHPCTVIFTNFQSGSFGTTGIRDITPVTNEDGTVAFTGTQYYFSATLSDPTGAAYEGVYSYDLATNAISQVGVLFVNRNSSGSKLMNDNAAHIIEDGAGHFHFFITSWGNAGGPASGINILYKHETSLNLLSGINAVASMTQPTLPNITSGGGTYDPYAVSPDGGLWYLAYTIGPNADLSEFPSLATTSDLSTYTDAGQDPTAVPYEGTRITKLAGSYWLLTSSLANDVNAYDLGTFTFEGKVKLTIPNVSGGTHYPPHPTIFSLGEYDYLTTFDNTVTNGVQGTQGAFRVFRARRYGAAQ